MTRRALALLLLAAAGPAAADTVRVRSGEHEGFSRLVLEFAVRPDWSVSRSEGRVLVRFAPGGDGFALGDVFARIPRTRIRAVTEEDGGLAIDLGCACGVEVFAVREAALAIDVSDEVEGDPPLTDVRQTSAEVPVGPPPAVDGSAPWPPLPLEAGESVPGPPAMPDDGAEGRPRAPLPGLADAAPPDPGPQAEGPPAPSPGALSLLTEGIARASTQGLLRLAPASPSDASDEGATADLPTGNLRLRVPGEMPAVLPETEAGEACPGDPAFDVAAWVPPDLEPAAAIAAARAALAPDIDAVSEEAALALARLYVGLGFGAEARAVVAAFVPRHGSADLLSAMAAVADGDAPADGGLAALTDCDGRAQLWATLATGTPGAAEDVVVAASELPLPLRRTLGPRLIGIFAEAGDLATAESIRAAIVRAAGPHGDGLAVASARLDGDPAALDRLRAVAESASPAADEALATYLELAPARDPDLDDDVMARAASRAEDLRGTEAGARIETAAIRAALASGDLATAGAALGEAIADGSLPEAAWVPLAEEVLGAAAERGDDAAVVLAASALEGPGAAAVRGTPAARAVAARLLDLGLPGLARPYLPAIPRDATEAALIARLHLRSADPEAAMDVLDRVAADDPGLLRLRAEALVALGRPREAADLFRALGDPTAMEDALWRTDDWSAVAARGGPRGDAAALIAADSADPVAAPDLLDASAETRARIEALLAAVPAP